MLTEDQQRAIQKRADYIAMSLYSCWTYYHVLRGMQRAVAKSPEQAEKNASAIEAMYRATFEALYIASCKPLDMSGGVESLKSLVDMAREYGVDTDLLNHFDAVFAQLRAKSDAPLYRLLRLRNKSAAHQTAAGYEPEFYEENKVALDEVPDAISSIETALDEIAYPLIGAHYLSAKGQTEHISEGCERLICGVA